MSAGLSQPVESLPRWARNLIIFVVLSFFAVYFGGIGLIFFARQITLNCLKPAEIVKVATDIAKFPNPLPEGFNFVFGMHLGPLSIVTVEHQGDKQSITVAAEQRNEVADAEALLKQSYDMGVNLPSTGLPAYAHFKSMKQKAEIEVAGEKMPYIVGELEDGSGHKLEGFIGSIAVKPAKRNILIFGLQPDGGSYKVDQTLCFLKGLTGF
jgi:hypothetical protein